MTFDFLTHLLPLDWQPYAKRAIPGFVAVIALIIHAIASGNELNEAEFALALTAWGTTSIAFWTRNRKDGVGEFAKAILPAVATVIATVVVALVNDGDFGRVEWTVLITGLGSSLLTLIVPNAPIQQAKGRR